MLRAARQQSVDELVCLRHLADERVCEQRLVDERSITGDCSRRRKAFVRGNVLHKAESGAKTAQRLAEDLEGHPGVEGVRYPGLPSHPQHELAKRQLALSGGLLTFDVAGGLEGGRRFVEGTRIAQLATSLGGPEIEHQ